MDQPHLRRDAAFSFACARCGRCCQGQAIQLNGFEIARLAQALGLCTTETIARHTTNGGQFLRFGPDGACPFLGDDGCRVHAHRPLLCRLYPLGRELDGRGGEGFVPLRPHPLCAGRRGEQGRVGDFLAAQEALPFLKAADLYLEATHKFVALAQARRPVLDLEWYNLDQALAFSGLDVLPGQPWRKMELHLRLLHTLIAEAWGAT